MLGFRSEGTVTGNVVIYLTVLLSILLVCQTSMAQSRLRLKNGRTIRNLKLSEISDDHVKFWTDKREIEIRKSAVKWVETKRFVFQFDTGNLVWKANKCNDLGYRQVASVEMNIEKDTILKFKHFNYDSIAIGPCFRPKFNQKFKEIQPTIKLTHYHRLTPASQILFPIAHLGSTAFVGCSVGLFGSFCGLLAGGVLYADAELMQTLYRSGALIGSTFSASAMSYYIHGHSNGLASLAGAISGVAIAYMVQNSSSKINQIRPFLPILCAFSLNEIVLWYKVKRHPHVKLW